MHDFKEKKGGQVGFGDWNVFMEFSLSHLTVRCKRSLGPCEAHIFQPSPAIKQCSFASWAQVSTTEYWTVSAQDNRGFFLFCFVLWATDLELHFSMKDILIFRSQVCVQFISIADVYLLSVTLTAACWGVCDQRGIGCSSRWAKKVENTCQIIFHGGILQEGGRESEVHRSRLPSCLESYLRVCFA